MLKIKKQGSFFVGSFPDRMYVQYHVPARVRHPEPLIMIPGGAHTGACYESTPDGREGWRDHFLRHGFRVYIVDWPGTGRSGAHPGFSKLRGETIVRLLLQLLERLAPVSPVILLTHSMSGAYGWKVAEEAPHLVAKIVALAPAPPGNIMPPSTRRFAHTRNLITKEEARTMWAESTQFPSHRFEQYFASLDALSPRLADERVNYRRTQLTITPGRLRNIKILVVTGDADPRHPREHDFAIVNFFCAHGVEAEHCWLPRQGLVGNGHLLMLEKNSAEIAEIVRAWITTKSAPHNPG